MRRGGQRRAGWLEGALWVASLGCAGYCAGMYALRQSAVGGPVAGVAAASGGETSARGVAAAGGPASAGEPNPGEVIGRLEIRSIGLSVPVLEDDEAQSLDRGVGHIRSTAMPGGLGTVGLAGHRDTFLRPLSRIEPGMAIRLTGAGGVYRYVVDSTEVVEPEAVRVLEIGERPGLVIVTCYPFRYVGPAPRRFVVHAHLESLIPG